MRDPITSLMKDYSYHDWSKYMVREYKDAPKGTHYGAVLFGTRTEYSSGYDGNGCVIYTLKPEITYFAFPSKELLEAWVERATRANKQFFIFQAKTGEATVKVSIDIDL